MTRDPGDGDTAVDSVDAATLDACSFGPPSGPGSPFTGGTDDG